MTSVGVTPPIKCGKYYLVCSDESSWIVMSELDFKESLIDRDVGR